MNQRLSTSAGSRLASSFFGRQFLRYSVVGAGGYLLHVVAFNLSVVLFAFGVYWAQLLASALSVSLTFLAHRSWTFSGRDLSAGFSKAFMKYWMVQAIAFPIPLVCIWVADEILGYGGLIAANISGNIVGVGLAFVVRYGMSSAWVFGEMGRSKIG